VGIGGNSLVAKGSSLLLTHSAISLISGFAIFEKPWSRIEIKEREEGTYSGAEIV
jgi:hypothetical protein